jgi:hypothetical protein
MAIANTIGIVLVAAVVAKTPFVPVAATITLNAILNQTCDQIGKAIILSISESVLDRDVLAFYKALGAETIPKGDEQLLAFLG